MANKKDSKEITIRSSTAEYLTFVAATGDNPQSVEMRYEDENIWLTQKMMGVIFDVETHTINYHLKKVFSDREIDEDTVIRNFRITAADGKSYDTKHYNLTAIFAVGFKVNSEKAIQFRKWVNEIASEFTIKAWVMDTERLKHGHLLTDKYFEEQLARIREIRMSERKFYQKITDIYTTAMDYDKNAETTRRFYATVQNKLHWAIHSHTAAELIVERADHKMKNMGLNVWQDGPNGKIKTTDVVVAKNYLDESELNELERIVTMYLDYAEDMTIRKIPMTMQDWEKRLNAFLQFNDREILQDSGKVTTEIAKSFALSEFEKYRITQDRLFESDFDRHLKLLENKSAEKTVEDND